MIETITKQLRQKDGIWMSDKPSVVSYPEERRDTLFELEDYSFWYQHRNRCIETIVKRFPSTGTILDLGGGNGYVTNMLSRICRETILLEPSLNGCLHAKQRGIKNIVCAKFDELSFVNVQIDGIGLFDVLEHVKDEEVLLNRIFNALTPAGKLYITCPAYSSLWSSHDELAGHYRRYTKKSLTESLFDCGFQIEYISYFFGILIIPVFLFRRLPYLLGHRIPIIKKEKDNYDHQPSGFFRNIANSLLDKECKALGRSTLKIGTSLIAVAKKK